MGLQLRQLVRLTKAVPHDESATKCLTAEAAAEAKLYASHKILNVVVLTNRNIHRYYLVCVIFKTF